MANPNAIHSVSVQNNHTTLANTDLSAYLPSDPSDYESWHPSESSFLERSSSPTPSELNSTRTLKSVPKLQCRLDTIERLVDDYNQGNLSPDQASGILRDLAGPDWTVHDGWCWLSTKKTNKPKDHGIDELRDKIGYVQVSVNGHNHIALLHMLAAFAGTSRAPEPQEHASHLCGTSVCFRPSHVIWESAQANNSRKGCLVWLPIPAQFRSDPGVPRLLNACPHKPRCVKAIPMVLETEFRANPGSYIVEGDGV